jgi:hypothetical protein
VLDFYADLRYGEGGREDWHAAGRHTP